MAEVRIPIQDQESALMLCGFNEENLKLFEAELGIRALLRGEELVLDGNEPSVLLGKQLIEGLKDTWSQGRALEPRDFQYALAQLKQEPLKPLKYDDVIITTLRGRQVRAKTVRQKEYLEAIATNTLVFGIGPAGTGKTYLAVAAAVKALRDKEVNRLILTRPAVEAGESLGFLPGDFQAKVDPYFRPLYDALYDLMDGEKFQKLVERGQIEIAPLAYMRGRTLNDAFIILDEAQNTTPEQMKMFLTRLGFGSKIVVTGDATQVDLPRGKRSGLADIERVLKGIPDIGFIHFGDRDVVRHDLVRRIVLAYQKQHDDRKDSTTR
ncbi:MAG: PhoH family protein [Bacteroidota bacterium]